MKKLLAGVAVLAAVAMAAQSSSAKKGNSDAGITSTGGPDAYGYTWIDSREPGGPSYNWIDISGIGTQITGLGDDGYVGPFSLGFNFPYYWYTTNKVWLQFNGAIELSTPTGMYHPGNNSMIPSPMAPNDLIVFMGADLDYTIGGHAYFWTNGRDTAIIQVDSVREWNAPSSYHSAEVILFLEPSNPNNGHILVQYGPQNGNFDNGGQGIHSAIGIEDITGNVGLQFLRDNVPSGNMPFDGLAVLYKRPPSSSYQVTDVGIDMLWHEDNLGFFLHSFLDTINIPLLRAKNFGNQPFSSFQAIVTIKNFYGSVVYADTVDGGALNPGDTVTLSFKPFNARTLGNGVYSLNGRVILSGDMNPGNNTVDNVEFRIVDNTTPWLGWDNDQTEIGFTWWIGGANGDAGWGARFPLPYDYHVDSVVAYAGTNRGAGGQVQVALLADNGSGMPGDTIVISNDINIPNDGAIHTAKVAVNQDFTGGTTLYGALFQMTDSTGCGVDDMTPFSRNFLEYTGTWAPYRDREANDAYIRLYGRFTVDVAETGKPQSFVLNSIGPVPTRDKASFSFTVPARGDVSLSLYNSAGRRVMARTETFEAGAGRMDLDLSPLSDGVYIYRLNYSDTRLSGKLIITR